ncbi:MAG: type IV secretory system conjugative DNA transfer family protein [Bacteroidota bacterium]
MYLFRFLRWLFSPLIEWILCTKSALPSYQASFTKDREILKKKASGFCLTGLRSLSRVASFQNALVVGPSGAGKSSVVYIPSILKAQDASLVIHDPSGELYQKTSGYLEQQGYAIQILNFADERHSDGFNPLIRAKSSSQINKVASMIIHTALPASKGDPFWNLQAISLLSLLITVVKKENSEYQTLRNVRELVHLMSSDVTKVEALVKATKESSLWQEFQSFVGFDEKVKAGVIASVLSALQIFSDDTVARVTSFDSIAPDLFRVRKTALFIQNSVADGRYYNVLSSLFFEQFFTSLFKRLPHDWEHDILFLIDEAGILHIPSLAQVISNVRKYRAGILLGLQDPHQLIEHYGKAEAETIKTNCFAHLYFAGQSHKNAEEISQVLGKTEFTDESGKIMIRPLLTGDQVRMLSPKEAILIMGHHPPMKPEIVPYYRQAKLKKKTEIPRPYLARKLPHSALALNPTFLHGS